MEDIPQLIEPLAKDIERETDKAIQDLDIKWSGRGCFVRDARGEFVREIARKADLLIQFRVQSDPATIVLESSRARALCFVGRESQRSGLEGKGVAINEKARWETDLQSAFEAARSRVMLEAMLEANHREPWSSSSAQKIEIHGNTGGDITVLANQNAGGTIQSPQQDVGRSAATLGKLNSVLAGPVLALWKWLAGGQA